MNRKGVGRNKKRFNPPKSVASSGVDKDSTDPGGCVMVKSTFHIAISQWKIEAPSPNMGYDASL